MYPAKRLGNAEQKEKEETYLAKRLGNTEQKRKNIYLGKRLGTIKQEKELRRKSKHSAKRFGNAEQKKKNKKHPAERLEITRRVKEKRRKKCVLS